MIQKCFNVTPGWDGENMELVGWGPNYINEDNGMESRFYKWKKTLDSWQ